MRPSWCRHCGLAIYVRVHVGMSAGMAAGDLRLHQQPNQRLERPLQPQSPTPSPSTSLPNPSPMTRSRYGVQDAILPAAGVHASQLGNAVHCWVSHQRAGHHGHCLHAKYGLAQATQPAAIDSPLRIHLCMRPQAGSCSLILIGANCGRCGSRKDLWDTRPLPALCNPIGSSTYPCPHQASSPSPTGTTPAVPAKTWRQPHAWSGSLCL